ncbi:MAG: phosphotransferase [Chloroflexi bacterium]|nr:phosphotransferase [Chloroflexota bacterium]
MREVLDRIFKAHGLGRAGHVTRPVDGRNNPIYIVDNRLVVRFDGLTSADTTDPELTTRFAGEAWVYRALAGHGLPTPNVLVIDDSREIAPMPYIVMSFLADARRLTARSSTARQLPDVSVRCGAVSRAYAQRDVFRPLRQVASAS